MVAEISGQNPHRLVIEAGQGDRQYWRDLWRYRELFGFLAWRDILVRYKQTVVGIAWAVLQPLLTMLVMTVVFGIIADLPSGDIPYPILVFAAMLPWQFFANSLSNSGNSLVSNASLISKVYFPRMIVPGSAVVVSLVDFLISFAILIVMMVIFGFAPTWKMLTLPVFILLAFVPAIGLGLLITALNVRYRDFRFVVPFVVQFGLFVSPVGFSSDLVREKFGDTIFLLYSMNPMVGVIDGFRWAILGNAELYWPGFCLSIGIGIAALLIGVRYFRTTERTFADVI